MALGGDTMPAMRYQVRLWALMAAVAITALARTAVPYLNSYRGWAIRGFPDRLTYVQVTAPDGSVQLIDSRLWPIHLLNPANRQ
jgi:hypothetical protein